MHLTLIDLEEVCRKYVGLGRFWKEKGEWPRRGVRLPSGYEAHNTVSGLAITRSHLDISTGIFLPQLPS